MDSSAPSRASKFYGLERRSSPAASQCSTPADTACSACSLGIYVRGKDVSAASSFHHVSDICILKRAQLAEPYGSFGPLCASFRQDMNEWSAVFVAEKLRGLIDGSSRIACCWLAQGSGLSGKDTCQPLTLSNSGVKNSAQLAFFPSAETGLTCPETSVHPQRAHATDAGYGERHASF